MAVRVTARRIPLGEFPVVLRPFAVPDGRLTVQLRFLRMGAGHALQHPRGPVVRLRGGHHRLTRVLPVSVLCTRRFRGVLPSAAVRIARLLGAPPSAALGPPGLLGVPPSPACLHPRCTIVAACTGHRDAGAARPPSPPATLDYLPTTPSVQPRTPAPPKPVTIISGAISARIGPPTVMILGRATGRGRTVKPCRARVASRSSSGVRTGP